MRVEYIKDSEPHFEGSVVDVSTETGELLIENGTAKEVDPRKVELRNVAADKSQDGISITDKRKKGIDEDKTSKTPKAEVGETKDETPEVKETKPKAKPKAKAKK